MNEVEKLYENAEVKKQIPKVCSNNELYCKECEAHIEDAMPYCKNADYPQFTAEKQLEIVKFMFHKGIYYDTDGDTYWFHYTDDIENATYRPFEEAIAEFINVFWQDLTEEEKEQIKEILEQ